MSSPQSVKGRICSIGATLKTVPPATPDGPRMLKGWANRPKLDRVNEVIDAKAFNSAVDIFKENPIMLYMHDPRRPIGKFTALNATPDGFFVEGEIARGTEDAETAWTLAEQGVLKAFSVGFREVDSQYEEDTGIKHITDLELYEISVVSIPANREALFAVENGKLLDITVLEEQKAPSVDKPSELPVDPPASPPPTPPEPAPAGDGAEPAAAPPPSEQSAGSLPPELLAEIAALRADVTSLREMVEDHDVTLGSLLKREVTLMLKRAEAAGIDLTEDDDTAPSGATH